MNNKRFIYCQGQIVQYYDLSEKGLFFPDPQQFPIEQIGMVLEQKYHNKIQQIDRCDQGHLIQLERSL